jgi:hypothetical protein
VGSGAGEGQERERRTWLAEDPEIWTDDTAVAPPVIGGDEQPSHDTSDVPSDTRNGTAEPGADAITEAGEDEPAVMLDIAELEAELEAELGLEIPGPETEDDGSAGQQLDPALGGSGDGVWSDNDRHDRPRSGNPPASP